MKLGKATLRIITVKSTVTNVVHTGVCTYFFLDSGHQMRGTKKSTWTN